MLAFLITIADNALGFFTQKSLSHFFGSKKKSESTDQIDAIIKIHDKSLDNAVKAKGLELELAQEQKDKARIQAELNELKNRQADPEKALQEEAEFKAKIKADLEREGNEAGAEKMAEAQDALENGDFSKAIEFFTEIKKREELGGKRSARASLALGEIAEQEVRWHDAAEHYARAAQLDPCFETLIRAQKLAVDVGNYDSALYFGIEAKKVTSKKYGEDSKQYALCINNLAGLYLANGEYKKAEYFLEETLKIYKNIFGENHYEIADTLNNIGGIYKEQEYYKKAEEFFNQALKIYEDTFGENHPDTANCFNNLGSVYQKQARYEEAGLFLNKSLKINKNIFGKDHPITAKSLNNLATFYHEQGQYKEAVPLYQQAIEISENILGPDHPQTKLFKENYEDLQKAIANAENDEPQ